MISSAFSANTWDTKTNNILNVKIYTDPLRNLELHLNELVPENIVRTTCLKRYCVKFSRRFIFAKSSHIGLSLVIK